MYKLMLSDYPGPTIYCGEVSHKQLLKIATKCADVALEIYQSYFPAYESLVLAVRHAQKRMENPEIESISMLPSRREMTSHKNLFDRESAAYWSERALNDFLIYAWNHPKSMNEATDNSLVYGILHANYSAIAWGYGKEYIPGIIKKLILFGV